MSRQLKLILGGPVVVLVGVVMIYWGFSERSLAKTASAEPEEMRLADLIARGPEGNSHVMLTEFELSDNFVYEKKRKYNSWEKVWIPIVPKGGAPATPEGESEGPTAAESGAAPSGPISAILLSKHVSGVSEIGTKLSNQSKLRGMVTNLIDTLGGSERKLLEESYPGTDFKKCIIFEEGRGPSGFLSVLGFWAGGVLLILIGVGCLYAGFKPERDTGA